MAEGAERARIRTAGPNPGAPVAVASTIDMMDLGAEEVLTVQIPLLTMTR
jgi:hypothetical protein